MKRFVPPPNWPIPPRRNWIPPESWRPEPSWPSAPAGWHFWRDAKGRAVLGPIGRYGAPSRRAAYAGGAALLVFLLVNIWAVAMIGFFNNDQEDPAAVTFAAESPATSPAVPATTPTQAPSELPSTRPTHRPTRKATAVSATKRSTPTPDRSVTTTDRPASPPTTRPTGRPTPKTSTTSWTPRRPTGTPPTREDLLRQYCLDRNLDPVWCDPDTWQRRNP
ncbi:hypothetical protein [Kribbella sp. NPDC048915]|uniref:hypothetical protein n=1 Tax=Kribbella sp. NPDC048915 TaxID=3155148 RepID=UPI0033CE3074